MARLICGYYEPLKCIVWLRNYHPVVEHLDPIPSPVCKIRANPATNLDTAAVGVNWIPTHPIGRVNVIFFINDASQYEK